MVSSLSPITSSEKEVDEGILVDDSDDAPRGDRSEHRRDEADNESSSTGSVIGDISVFRDFFLAAFADGYYKVRYSGRSTAILLARWLPLDCDRCIDVMKQTPGCSLCGFTY